MRSKLSLSSASFAGMVLVSWISILALAGVWGSLIYDDFTRQSEQLREQFLKQRQNKVRTMAEQAGDLVVELRKERLDQTWDMLRRRSARAARAAQVLSGQVESSAEKILPGILQIMQGKEDGGHAFFETSGNTIYMLSPFMKWEDRAAVMTTFEKGLVDFLQGIQG